MFRKYAKAFLAAGWAAVFGYLDLLVVEPGPWQKWGMAAVAVLTALGVAAGPRNANADAPAARE
jgi:hypothetical protein